MHGLLQLFNFASRDVIEVLRANLIQRVKHLVILVKKQ